LICLNPDPLFSWCEPEVAHVHWDHKDVLDRVIRWTRSLASGKVDRERVLTQSRFVIGGTVGPVPA
jgi:hypothetical protein